MYSLRFNKLINASVVLVGGIMILAFVLRFLHKFHHPDGIQSVGGYYQSGGGSDYCNWDNEWNGLAGYRGPWPSCPKREAKKEAYVTLLLTNDYTLTTLKLKCSMEKVNATRPLLVLYDQNEILDSTLDKLHDAGIETRPIGKMIKFPNTFAKRFSINWTKLKLWKMEEFTKIVYLDSDMFMVQNVDHLFDIGVDFAITADADRFVSSCSPFGFNQAGLFVLSPCRAVFDHMYSMVKHNETLQFRNSDAEQGFLNYYYQYNRVLLPTSYNFLAYRFWNTPLRDSAKVIHYTAYKPFHIKNKEDEKDYHQPWLDCDISNLGPHTE